MTGDAPCAGCGKHIFNIPIDEHSRESDGNGGYWFNTLTESRCMECGEPLRYFHIPPLSFFTLDNARQLLASRVDQQESCCWCRDGIVHTDDEHELAIGK